MTDQATDCIAQLEDVMLTKMWEAARGSMWGDDGTCFGLKFFDPIPKEVARGMLRTMRNEGKVVFHIGLWSEDGEPRGAGYALSGATCREFAKLDEEGESDGGRLG